MYMAQDRLGAAVKDSNWGIQLPGVAQLDRGNSGNEAGKRITFVMFS